MKKGIVFVVSLFFVVTVLAQQNTLYKPDADAAADIKALISKAAAENKYVLIQAGGNWCRWCLEFNRFTKSNIEIDSVLQNSYILYHLNYSKENKNKEIFSQFKFPQRFGFPVFLILNEKGELIHTQNSEYLEDGKSSYNKEKVISFLQSWSPHAFNPQLYK